MTNKKVVVISGLAQGMGREVAKILATAGVSVAGFDRDAEGLRDLAGELDKIGVDHFLKPVDISDRNAVRKFRDDVLEKFGHVDTVLSNVGIGFFGPFEEADQESALKCLEINVIGMATLFQSFIPAMRVRGTGKLIAMSSLVGQVPFPFESIYTASKFAVEGLVQSLKLEVKPFGINVAIIQPAQVSTGFAAKVHVVPEEGSAYHDRVKRFIDRDNELIKTAPMPKQAAQTIAGIVQSDNPKLFNQIDKASTFFLWLNRYLPRGLRDMILLNHMDIKA